MAILSKGYEPIPLKENKTPAAKKWNTREIDEKFIAECRWRFNGLGIRCTTVQALDLDIVTPELSEMVQRLAERLLGVTTWRTGLAPKVLTPVRAPWFKKKIVSPAFYDSAGRKNQIEVLGPNNQFAAYSWHAKAGKPYAWSGDNPIDTKVNAWPIMSKELLIHIMVEFQRFAKELGMEAR